MTNQVGKVYTRLASIPPVYLLLLVNLSNLVNQIKKKYQGIVVSNFGLCKVVKVNKVNNSKNISPREHSSHVVSGGLLRPLTREFGSAAGERAQAGASTTDIPWTARR
jgi:hypothetical protein